MRQFNHFELLNYLVLASFDLHAQKLGRSRFCFWLLQKTLQVVNLQSLQNFKADKIFLRQLKANINENKMSFKTVKYAIIFLVIVVSGTACNQETKVNKEDTTRNKNNSYRISDEELEKLSEISKKSKAAADEFNSSISILEQKTIVDDDFKKFSLYKIKNTGKRTITSFLVNSTTAPIETFLIKKNVKPNAITTIKIPEGNGKGMIFPPIRAVRFSDGTTIGNFN